METRRALSTHQARQYNAPPSAAASCLPATGKARMTKGQWLTPHQRGIVRRYYEHKDTLAVQRLSEIASELSTCDDEKQAARLWRQARTALVNAGAHRAQVEGIVAARDLERLVRLIAKLF